jgi:cell pole-organizing protein PopZ
MTQPAKAQEPSMEEILASIRRIIADDDAAKAPPPEPVAAAVPLRPASPTPPPPAPPPSAAVLDEMLADLNATSPPAALAEEDVDVLELTEAMTAPEPEFRTIDGQSDIVFDESLTEPAPEPVRERALPPAPRVHFPEQSHPPLMSAATSAAVDSAFNTLAHTVLVQNARTLEDLVKEMLQPLLKTWLDDNLPGMVERLVRAEIERVSRGRG